MSSIKIAAGVAALTTLVALVSLVVSLWVVSQDDLYDPLGEYPVQSVDEVTATTITTTGTKCNASHQDVEIVGTFNWFRVIPPGFGTEPVNGARTAIPGCETNTFTNTIPESVLAVNQPNDVWFLTGTEYPIDPATGERGAPRTWQTENFSIPVDGEIVRG